jgi:hypothetical protein
MQIKIKNIEQIPAFGRVLRSAGLLGESNKNNFFLNKYWIKVQYYVLISRLSCLRPSSYSAAREEVVAQNVIWRSSSFFIFAYNRLIKKYSCYYVYCCIVIRRWSALNKFTTYRYCTGVGKKRKEWNISVANQGPSQGVILGSRSLVILGWPASWPSVPGVKALNLSRADHQHQRSIASNSLWALRNIMYIDSLSIMLTLKFSLTKTL